MLLIALGNRIIILVLHLMLSDDTVEDGTCLARNSLVHSDLEGLQITLIGKHAHRQGVLLLSCAH